VALLLLVLFLVFVAAATEPLYRDHGDDDESPYKDPSRHKYR
jgi:hypothetical protein